LTINKKKINLFSNKTLSELMLRMQDFALSISNVHVGPCSQTLLDKFGRLRGPQRESRNLEGKVNFLFHFPLGK
jgi:hypothetical protein